MDILREYVFFRFVRGRFIENFSYKKIYTFTILYLLSLFPQCSTIGQNMNASPDDEAVEPKRYSEYLY